MYDVFISFKNSDSNGNKTKDSTIAERLYYFLKDKGLSVFFSNIELESKGVDNYSKYINDALKSSTFLIAVGCSQENLESKWVCYEWDSFLNAILSGRKPKEAKVFVFFQDMNLNELPFALSNFQAFDASDYCSYEKLYSYIINASISEQDVIEVPSVSHQETESEQQSKFVNTEAVNKVTKATPANDIQFDHDIYFLRASAKEKKDILRHIEDELGLTEGSKCYDFFYNLLNDPNSDSVSMIEINIARKYFGRVSPDVYDSVLDQENPMELIIEKYFEIIFSAMEDPNLAMIILYSLCNCGYSDGLTISDLKNITFATQETIETMLRIFKDQEIIKQIKPITESPYIMTHDYLIIYLDTYCSKKLSEQIITNIRFYCLEKNKRREKIGKSKIATGERKKNESLNVIPLSLYYRNSIIKKTSGNIILFCIRLLCITILFSSVLLEMKGYEVKYFLNFGYEWNHNIHTFSIIAIGCCIFYIYHYLQYFAKIFFSKIKRAEFWICVLLILWGMIAVNLVLFINGLWATWLALEWMLIGILHLFLSRRTLSNENAKKRLSGEGLLYIVIAVVFIALNIIVFRGGYSMPLWLFIYIFFIFFTIRQHIHTDFMLAKIGAFVNLSMMEDQK